MIDRYTDFKEGERDMVEENESLFQLKFPASSHRFYDKRKFSYPTYLVSEDYHIIDDLQGVKGGLQVQSNRKMSE